MDRHRAQQVYCVALGLAACVLAAFLATQQPFPAILPLVLLGGLVAFAAASAGFAAWNDLTWLWLARLGQGAAASAFSRP